MAFLETKLTFLLDEMGPTHSEGNANTAQQERKEPQSGIKNKKEENS